MPGKLHYEGQEYFANSAIRNEGLENLYIGLYTNLTELDVNSNMTQINEVVSVNRLPLSHLNWALDVVKTEDKGTLTVHPKVSWFFNSDIGIVTGYFITTTASGTTGKLLLTEHFKFPAETDADFELRVAPKIKIK